MIALHTKTLSLTFVTGTDTTRKTVAKAEREEEAKTERTMEGDRGRIKNHSYLNLFQIYFYSTPPPHPFSRSRQPRTPPEPPADHTPPYHHGSRGGGGRGRTPPHPHGGSSGTPSPRHYAGARTPVYDQPRGGGGVPRTPPEYVRRPPSPPVGAVVGGGPRTPPMPSLGPNPGGPRTPPSPGEKIDIKRY